MIPWTRPMTVAVMASAAAIAMGSPRDADPEVSVTWRAVPVTDVARGVEAILGMPVLLDRRLDPTTPITLEARSSPRDLLAEVARQAGGEVVLLARSVRIAIPGHRAALQAAEEMRQDDLSHASENVGRRFSRERPASWPPAATPRQVVESLAKDLEIVGLELLPHDHLRGGRLAAIPLGDQLDLVLADFDLRARPRNDGRVELIPIDATASPRRPPRRFPGGLAAPRGGAAPTAFTLQAAAPLDDLLAAVAARLELDLQIDRGALAAAGIDPRQIVRIDVTDVSRDELLAAIARPIGLTWRIEGSTLTLTVGDQSAP